MRLQTLIVTFLLCLSISSPVLAESGIRLSATLKSIMQQRCTDCHNKDKKKGKLDLTQLLASPNKPELWQDIYDMVESGEMPPEDETPLKVAEKVALLKAIPVFQAPPRNRSLTPAEINHTLIDTFKANSDTFNAEGLLSVNYTDEAFHTLQQNVMSPYYVNDLYLTMQEAITSLVHARKMREPVTVNAMLSQAGHVSRSVTIKKKGGNKIKAADLRWKWQGRAPSFAFEYPGMPKNTLPAGVYELDMEVETPNFHAEIKSQKMAAPYQFLKEDGHFTVALYIVERGSLGNKHLVRFIQMPVERKRIQVKIEIARESAVAVALTKGPSGGKFKYQVDDVYGGKGLWKDHKYPLPSVRFYDVKITGPLSMVKADLTIHDKLEDSEVKRRLDLMQKAQYSKLDQGYYDSFEHFKTAGGMPFEKAYRKAILTYFLSNDFLEVNYDGDAREKTRYASYALLKSPVDAGFQTHFDQFLKTGSGKVMAEALVNDARFDRFVRTFASQWLKMERLKSNPPAKNDFGEFYKQKLSTSFPEETFAFFKHLFKANRPIHELVTADYSFLTPSLHAFYGTGDEDSDKIGFKEVVLSLGAYKKHQFKDANRGGILTQGAFLTVNSNGVEELPIRRAVWTLENILNRTVPDPSSSVDIEEFEAAHKLPFMERLELHRNNSQCNSCHQRIDPLAVIMNSYNTIGTMKKYPEDLTRDDRLKKIGKKKRLLDPSEIPTLERYEVDYRGTKLKGMADLKAYFKTQEKSIAKAFLINLLEFTLGRELIVSDHPKLDAIVQKHATSGLKTADLYGSFLEAYFRG